MLFCCCNTVRDAFFVVAILDLAEIARLFLFEMLQCVYFECCTKRFEMFHARKGVANLSSDECCVKHDEMLRQGFFIL